MTQELENRAKQIPNNMIWIDVNERHFVDINYGENHSYTFIENEHCPQEPFLVGLWVNNTETGATKFEYTLVILTENGLEEWADDCSHHWGAWNITDVEYWMKIESPYLTRPVSAENTQVQVAENSSDTDRNEKTMDKIYSFVSELDKPESKIQPGQKLKAGDWCKVTAKQCNDLFRIKNTESPDFMNHECIVSFGYNIQRFGWQCIDDDRGDLKEEYHFTDFKQLCKNTFQG